jgi:hypothetical protein
VYVTNSALITNNSHLYLLFSHLCTTKGRKARERDGIEEMERKGEDNGEVVNIESVKSVSEYKLTC